MLPTHFCAISYRFRDNTILNFGPPKKDTQCNFRSYTTRWQMSNSAINVSHAFFRQHLEFQKYNNFNFFTCKNMSRSQNTIFAVTFFDGEYRSLQTPFLRFLYSLRCDVRLDITGRHTGALEIPLTYLLTYLW